MIAASVIYVDLRAAPLAEPLRVAVFVAPETDPNTNRPCVSKSHTSASPAVRCGSTVTWDGRIWSVVNLGETSVGLLSEDQRLTELPMSAVESLIRQNRIEVTPPISVAAPILPSKRGCPGHAKKTCASRIGVSG